jgi:hypothetical protein
MVEGPNDDRWKEFDALGEMEVRKRVVAQVWGEEKQKLAEHWLNYQESQDSSASRRETLRLANEANDLARSANESALDANSIARASSDSAKRSAAAARTSNKIAAAALIAAIIAVVISVMRSCAGN